MGPLGDQLPKAMIPVCNRPLLAYQLDHMRSLGIEEVIVVVGYLGDLIQAAFGDGSAYNLRIRYVTQEKRLGLAHALGQLEEQVTAPFLLMLGDIYFDISELSKIFEVYEDTGAAAVLGVKEESDSAAIQRNFSVRADAAGRVSEVIEKPQATTATLKGCGVYVFDASIFEAIRRTPRSSLRNEFELTDSIQCLIEEGAQVQIADIVQSDINLTFVSDIVDCNVYELNKQGVSSCQGEGVVLAAGCSLQRSVLGDKVRIQSPILIEECVVLDGCVIHATTPLRRAVVTPHAILT